MFWQKVASIIGIVAALGAVWTRFVVLEARVDATEKVLQAFTVEMEKMNDHIQALEIQLAKKQ